VAAGDETVRNNTMEILLNFLKKLQNADDAAKKRVIAILTVVIMIIVVTIWLVYFNPVGQPTLNQ
jgi:uncharacterized membrane protein